MKQEIQPKSIVVVGSANMDMVVSVERFPRPGETILGDHFAMYPGGKGANQAVCCARLGASVHFIGKLGKDMFRDRLIANLRSEGILLDYMMEESAASTGIALITVDLNGQNEIIVVSGSNMEISESDLDERAAAFDVAEIVLLQLEIPTAAVRRAAELARANGAMVILNPAPARELPDELLELVHFLTPNETEAEILTGIEVVDAASAEIAGRALVDRGVRNVLLTLGAKGALLVNTATVKLFPAVPVRAVDTTAAGDAFNGALAFFLVGGVEIEEAVNLANTVAALSIGREGAQTSMPTYTELEDFLRRADGEPVEVSPEEL